MVFFEQLINFTAKSVPGNAVALMSLSLFDWSLCGLVGAQDGSYDDFVQLQQSLSEGPCSVFGGGNANAPTAALLNGTLSRALLYDDMHSGLIGPLTSSVLSAVVALGQEVNADVDAVIEASAIGVEAAVLVGIWLCKMHPQTAVEGSTIPGTLGATLGTCRLLGLDKSEIRAALALSSGMVANFGLQKATAVHPLSAGMAARSGVEAALWAQSGVTCQTENLTRPLGLFDAAGEDLPKIEFPKKLWNLCAIQHQFHSCSPGLHPVIEALRNGAVDPENIDTLTIRTHERWVSECPFEAPKTGQEAKLSLWHGAAMAILGYDTAAVSGFSDASTQIVELAEMRLRITVQADERLSPSQAEITVHQKRGGLLRLRHDISGPLNVEERAARLQEKACALIGEAQAEALWQATQGEDLRAVGDQLVMS